MKNNSIACDMSAPKTVEILNETLGHSIEDDGKGGFRLFDGFGFSGTFPSHADALAHYRRPHTNYDHASTPDGI